MWPKTWALAAIGEEEEEELSVLHLLSFKESRASRRKLLMPKRWQPTRLPRPWDSPGKNTGVGCHHISLMNAKE